EIRGGRRANPYCPPPMTMRRPQLIPALVPSRTNCAHGLAKVIKALGSPTRVKPLAVIVGSTAGEPTAQAAPSDHCSRRGGGLASRRQPFDRRSYPAARTPPDIQSTDQHVHHRDHHLHRDGINLITRPVHSRR